MLVFFAVFSGDVLIDDRLSVVKFLWVGKKDELYDWKRTQRHLFYLLERDP